MSFPFKRNGNGAFVPGAAAAFVAIFSTRVKLISLVIAGKIVQLRSFCSHSQYNLSSHNRHYLSKMDNKV